MLIDTISPIVFAVDLPPVGFGHDAALARRSVRKVAVRFLNPHFARLIANAVGRLSEGSDLTEAAATKVQHAEFFSRRNELVQDRDVWYSWYQDCSAIPGRE